jgi:hypothetical protein
MQKHARDSTAMIAALQPSERLPSHIMSVAKFERLFRMSARLDVDKADLKRHSDFINRKIYDLLVRGEETARLNGRDVIRPFDLPITKGVHECIRDFERLDETIGLAPILEYLAARPPLDLGLDEETEKKLPAVAGGLSLALARALKIISPDLKNPQTEDWQRAFQIFDILQ